MFSKNSYNHRINVHSLDPSGSNLGWNILQQTLKGLQNTCSYSVYKYRCSIKLNESDSVFFVSPIQHWKDASRATGTA